MKTKILIIGLAILIMVVVLVAGCSQKEIEELDKAYKTTRYESHCRW